MKQMMNQPNLVDDERFNVAEAVRFLRVSRATVTRLVQARKIGHVRVGRQIFFSRNNLNAFLEKNSVDATV